MPYQSDPLTSNLDVVYLEQALLAKLASDALAIARAVDAGDLETAKASAKRVFMRTEVLEELRKAYMLGPVTGKSLLELTNRVVLKHKIDPGPVENRFARILGLVD